MLRGARALGTLEETSQHGQQLFIADLFSRHGPPKGRRPYSSPPTPSTLPAATHRQMVLFDMARTLRHRGRRGLAQAADPGLAALTEQLVKERAARYGWSHGTICDVRAGVNIMLGFQDTPGVAITATDVAVLTEVNLPIRHVLAILSEAGMLEDDRVPALTTWFERQVHGLPEPMTEELSSWFRIMDEGSTTTPRQRPRTATTIRLYLGWALPPIRAWAAQGKNSLREISIDDVRRVLPTDGLQRAQAGKGLRSVFRILKARRILFTNPISQIKTGHEPDSVPTALNVTDIKEALDSPDPARALVAAFHAFHALRSLQMQRLKLADILDGRLTLGDRTVPLAEPVRQRLATYLDYRNRRWPNTANPHLLVHFRTANNTGHVGYRWIYLLLGPKLNTRSMRSDRFLHEALATGGDTRRLTDLFGLSFQAAQRYTSTLDNTELGGIQTTDTDHPGHSS
ncbi:hypothetical protein [Streptomyces sp. NBC_00354]|uniref:hypothetical protein n=1 Tax=Streptomyces sp. NBC_00354 TaxID=2975723 RepID=UPI002E254FBD